MTKSVLDRLIYTGITASVLLFQAPFSLAQMVDEEITYAKHIAPILQENCQICHQPNSIAPMSLLTYQDVKQFAPLIKYKIERRMMPPWHIDTTVGITEFKNDRGLTDAEIASRKASIESC